MQNKEVVSIIIPAYNVEDDLDSCIASVVVQTYQNLEVILVDDGSTDSTGKLCDTWSQLDKRIKVIHQMNQGMSGARNAGTNVARGSYIAYIDADDKVGPRYIECLVWALKASNTLMSATGFTKYNSSSPETAYKPLSVKVVSSEEALLSALNDQEIGFYAWGKLFDASLKPILVFPLGRAYEDQALLYKVFDFAKMIAFETACDYYYHIRPDSISNKTRTNIVDSYQALNEMYDYCKDEHPSFLGLIESRMLAACAEAYFALMCADLSSQDDYFFLLKDYALKAQTNRYLKPSIKFVYKLASINRGLLDCLLKLFNRMK